MKVVSILSYREPKSRPFWWTNMGPCFRRNMLQFELCHEIHVCQFKRSRSQFVIKLMILVLGMNAIKKTTYPRVMLVTLKCPANLITRARSCILASSQNYLSFRITVGVKVARCIVNLTFFSASFVPVRQPCWRWWCISSEMIKFPDLFYTKPKGILPPLRKNCDFLGLQKYILNGLTYVIQGTIHTGSKMNFCNVFLR